MNIGLVGTGKMGASIFRILSKNSFNITILAIDWDEAKKHERSYFRGIERAFKRGRVSEDELLRKKESIKFTNRINDLNKSELIIETIFEDFKAKSDLFEQLESVVSSDAIITTNTSSCSIEGLSRGIKKSHRFCGLHFFHPVSIMGLIEIVCAEATHDDTVLLLKRFCKTIKKKPVVVFDAPGSVVNSILSYYFIEALYILEEGHMLPSKIDFLAKKYFFAGPCESIDTVGIDFLIHALQIGNSVDNNPLLPNIKNTHGNEIEAKNIGGRKGFRIPYLFDKLMFDKRFGRKSKKGLYLYEKNGPIDDKPDYYRCKPVSEPQQNESLIGKRLLYALLNGVIYCINNKKATKTELDLAIKEVLLMKDGPITMMKSLGKKNVEDDFNYLSNNVGERYLQKNIDIVFS